MMRILLVGALTGLPLPIDPLSVSAYASGHAIAPEMRSQDELDALELERGDLSGEWIFQTDLANKPKIEKVTLFKSPIKIPKRDGSGERVDFYFFANPVVSGPITFYGLSLEKDEMGKYRAHYVMVSDFTFMGERQLKLHLDQSSRLLKKRGDTLIFSGDADDSESFRMTRVRKF